MASNNPVPKLYRTVVEDVISNVREHFLDDGVDDQVLQELKSLWEQKLNASKAVEPSQPKPDKLITAYTQHQQVLQQQHHVQHTQHLQHQPHHQPQQAQVQQTHVPSVFNTAAGTVQMSAAAQAAGMALPAGLYQQQLALQPGTIIQGQDGTQYIVQPAAMMQQGAQPQPQYTVGLPQGVQGVQGVPGVHMQIDPNQQRQQIGGRMVGQLDGGNDSSSDSNDDEKDDYDDDDDENENEDNEDQGEEEDPLNSGDDVSEEDPGEVFDTDNVVVCQYDKINRCKNRWKFHLKDGIMNVNGKDLVFQKATGDAEW